MSVQSFPILLIDVGGQRFGLPTFVVTELVRAVAVVPLPRAPAIVAGVINVRGTIVPVLNLHRRFRHRDKPVDPDDHFVIAKAATRMVALHVDRALGLIEIDPKLIEDARGAIPGIEYITWMAKLPDELVLIHDLDGFLSHAESLELNEAMRDVYEESPSS
ncbi:MAG: chemotaxis protein CheW [Gemmataceae bacterium]